MKLKHNIRIAVLAFVALFIGIVEVDAQFVANLGSYDGYWAGSLKNVQNEESTNYLVLRIENGKAKRLFYDEDKQDFEEGDFEKEMTSVVGNNLSYVWMNSGGIWSETQSHSLSYLKDQFLWCVMVRQVNNAKEDEEVEGINNEWNIVYEGSLNFYRSRQALREALLD
ncbi:hypothetical protein [Sphingobacterium sp. SGR-19]|uniref:hypothetical protein n=1 Tax=Sphingobacterium sp. SGR-19 TaxID=2710886 RepID=UPI0013EB938C|nr:hypothetical protein [Sphingobacterium sp. SGR-19]NGM65361.1 hypothetical protein [Sphingobacterium sp. SGR-19]